MPVVRYVALAALVVWLGGTLQIVGGDVMRQTATIAYICGAVMVLALVVMKFVGPPPRAFSLRVALAALMIAATAAGASFGRQRAATVATFAIGAVLLTWYSRE